MYLASAVYRNRTGHGLNIHRCKIQNSWSLFRPRRCREQSILESLLWLQPLVVSGCNAFGASIVPHFPLALSKLSGRRRDPWAGRSHLKNSRPRRRDASTDANCSDGSPTWNLCRFPSHSFTPPSFVKMRVIRAAAALNSGCAAGSRQGIRLAGLACRSVVPPSAPRYSFRLSGLRHFSRSPVSRSSTAADDACVSPEPEHSNWPVGSQH